MDRIDAAAEPRTTATYVDAPGHENWLLWPERPMGGCFRPSGRQWPVPARERAFRMYVLIFCQYRPRTTIS